MSHVCHNFCSAVFDNYVAAITVGGKSYELGLFDTAGQLGHQSIAADDICEFVYDLKN